MNEVKPFAKHISCDCKRKLNGTAWISNNTPAYVTSTPSIINSGNKKVRYKMDCFILRAFLSVHFYVHCILIY